MLCGEESKIKFYRTYGNRARKGVKEFIDIIDFEDRGIKDNLLDSIDDETELIWYPGCGGDVSPCSILERKEFEKENGIKSSNKRLYFFTDPRDHMSGKKFGGKRGIYDCSVEDYKFQYSIDKGCAISITGENNENLITGQCLQLSLCGKECNIIYLKMTYQDYLLLCVKLFELNFKWLFYLKMEAAGDGLFALYKKYDISYPEWICINRISRYTTIGDIVELKPMKRNNGVSYYINEERFNACRNVMYGKMINKDRKDNVMMQTDREKILEEITRRLTKDNGKVFTDTSRLDYIKMKLEKSEYEIMCENDLSVIYKKKDVDLPKKIVLISSHIDCKNKDNDDAGIYNPNFKTTPEGDFMGTFDNAATNAAILISMLENRLSENIVIAFTGDEEEDSKGAIQTIKYLQNNKKKVIAIALDVTYDMKSEKDKNTTTYNYASFTIDNLCANTSETVAKALFECANKMNIPYMITRVYDRFGDDYFEHKKCSDYYDKKLEVEDPASADEAVEFSEYKCCIGAFSLCLPTNDKTEKTYMHTDSLITIKKNSFHEYIDAVINISNRMTEV